LAPNEETLKGLDAVEEVLFIGYPYGIWDARNLLPIVRVRQLVNLGIVFKAQTIIEAIESFLRLVA
jgi:hypothetical protein